MSKPLITIIVPVYNVEKYLNKSIQSIQGQSYKNLEILLINDGSTDRSLEICKRYAISDDRIKVVSQPNGGVASVRNRGLAMASGKYIGIIDSDDYIRQDTFERMMAAMVEHDADLVEVAYTKIRDDGRNMDCRLKDAVISDNASIVENALLGVNTKNYIWNKLYKREIILNNQIDFPMLKHTEDYVFNLCYQLRIDKKVTLSECMYNYRIHSESACGLGYKPTMWDRIKASDLVIKKIKEMDKDEFLPFALWYKLKKCMDLYCLIKGSDDSDKKSLQKRIIKVYGQTYKSYMKYGLWKSYNRRIVLFKYAPSVFYQLRKMRKKRYQ